MGLPYTLRGVTGVATFEIEARPRARRRRACSEVSALKTEDPPKEVRRACLVAAEKEAEEQREMLGMRCAALLMLTPEKRGEIGEGCRRRGSLVERELCSVREGLVVV